MTALPTVEGLSVDILVDGNPLVKHDSTIPEADEQQLKLLINSTHTLDFIAVDVSNIKYVVKYIEASSNKRFAFRFGKEAGFRRGCHHLGVKWQVDGFETNIRHERIDSDDPDAPWTATSTGVGTGTAQTGFFNQFFKFGDLKTVENDEYSAEDIALLTAQVRDFGVLRVFVYQMQASADVSTQTYFDAPNEVEDKVPEKALKGRALSHKVQYDVERRSAQPLPRPADVFTHPRRLPYAIFEFRYRSKGKRKENLTLVSAIMTDGAKLEGLVQEGIIRRPPSLDNMNQDEIRLRAPSLVRAKHQLPLSVRDKQSASTSHRRQRPGATDRESACKRLKETRRADGKVLIDLISDNESDEEAHFNQANQQRAHVASAAQDGNASKRQNPDRRVRCQTVSDEESGPHRSTVASNAGRVHRQSTALREGSDAGSDVTLG
ncbi:hypothetical protein SUNI508_10320 [Seiridium unicorne]|uniref:DUF7918 domain-containing protein n=1 Tax=Seiridium unicorne TaxID=138068 RepID=A0ABR2UMZ5_9PEZI